MIPLLVPIGLGLIGGYLSQDSTQKFAKGGGVEDKILTTKDGFTVSGLKNYTITKKTGKFYQIYAVKEEKGVKESYWLRVTNKEGKIDILWAKKEILEDVDYEQISKYIKEICENIEDYENSKDIITKDGYKVWSLRPLDIEKLDNVEIKYYQVAAENDNELYTIDFSRINKKNKIDRIEKSVKKEITINDLPKSIKDLIFTKYSDGGNISKNIDDKLKEKGFDFNQLNYRYGKKIDENDYITAFYDKNKNLYKIRGVHKFVTPLGENSVGIQWDFSSEAEFWDKINEYINKSTLDEKFENGGTTD
jgi:hypothetical protein